LTSSLFSVIRFGTFREKHFKLKNRARDIQTKIKIIQVALGCQKADLRIHNGKLVNVYSGEILENYCIDIVDRHIAYVGPSRGDILPETENIDAKGAYLLPGYIDPHAHLDFWANPLALTGHLLAGGTTTLMTDPHDIVGAAGLAGLEFLMDITRGLPLKFFFSLPVSSPPFPEFEGEVVVPLSCLEEYLGKEGVIALSEVTPWIRLIFCDKDLLNKFEKAERLGKRIEGHTSGASFDKLNALVGAGLTSCHEALDVEEAIERLRLGLAVMLRHGSIRSDMEALIPLVTKGEKLETRWVMLTPDWKSPLDILEEGYMDHLVGTAIRLGVEPVTAIQMATINPATYLRVDEEYGSLVPGRRADILIVDNIKKPFPRVVIADGKIVARNGEVIVELPSLPSSSKDIPWMPYRKIQDFNPSDFVVRGSNSVESISVPSISIVNKTLTRRKDLTIPSRGGRLFLPSNQDILKISLLNKEGTGFITAFLTGFGARIGGLASSVAHEHHRPMVVGCRETDMAAALRRVIELRGGMVLVHEGNVLGEIPLPIAGLMSDRSLEEVASQMETMRGILREMGCSLEDPIFTLGFLSFSSLPWIRITPSGLLDVKNRKIIWP
jgi:adenine deaminase